VRHKRKLLQLQLLNFFENTFKGQLENKYLHPEEKAVYQQAYFDTDPESIEEDEPDEAISDNTIPDEAFTLSADMQELIDSLLEESKITKELDKKQAQLKTAATNEKFNLVEEIIKEYL
jgi:hypothetical protein